MADGNESPENGQKTGRIGPADEAYNTEERTHPFLLDLGDDFSRVTETNRLGIQSAGTSSEHSARVRPDEAPRDNPFSFKHFIRSDVHAYQGARPKVYCEGRPVASVSELDFAQEKQTRLEYPSALPDFVQDHLVVEQCYLGNAANSNFNLDLPDFAPGNRLNADSSHDDLAIPLDLPGRPQFPLDLPSQQNGTRTSEVGVSKSLPDFLADGAVRNSEGQSAESPERECDRLRRELEVCKGQLAEQTRRAEALTRELEIARNKEHDYTQNLAKALEEVEKNLERSNMRTTSAENTIVKLRQEIKSLVSQLNSLKSENSALRGEEGAAGGHGYYTPNEMHSQRLAQELKAAASTAEHSLRQLLTGVDNLRIMAATLENMHRIEEKRESFLDLDEDTGPAL